MRLILDLKWSHCKLEVAGSCPGNGNVVLRSQPDRLFCSLRPSNSVDRQFFYSSRPSCNGCCSSKKIRKGQSGIMGIIGALLGEPVGRSARRAVLRSVFLCRGLNSVSIALKASTLPLEPCWDFDCRVKSFCVGIFVNLFSLGRAVIVWTKGLRYYFPFVRSVS